MKVAIVQARMASTRLPGKAMMDLDGKPVIQHVLERARAAETVDEVVLATTTLESDDVLADWARDNGYLVFRGSPTDVLKRLYMAARLWGATVVIRLTGDCPRLEPGVIDKVVRELNRGPCEFASNIVNRTYPKGLDTEVVTIGALRRLEKLTKTDREDAPFHLLYEGVFVGRSVEAPTDHSDVNLCVDTEEDLERLREISDKSASR